MELVPFSSLPSISIYLHSDHERTFLHFHSGIESLYPDSNEIKMTAKKQTNNKTKKEKKEDNPFWKESLNHGQSLVGRNGHCYQLTLAFGRCRH